MQVIKKNGNQEEWNDEKIVKAILKSADHSSLEITKNQATQVAEYCKKQIQGNVVETSKLHGIVIDALRMLGYSEIANSYRNYRNFKETDYETWREMYEQAEHIIYRGDNENANFDSSLISTKGSLIKGNATKRIYQDFILNKNEKFLTRRGDIYIHDMRDMIFGSVNCCLFDIANVLKNGFTMSNIRYNEPNSVLSALQVIGDITLVATAQQFGGFTLPEIDKVLLPYVKKSFNKYMDMYTHRKVSRLDAEKYAIEDTLKELQQGFQGLELKLNTVPCSRGDFAFTTLTFGQWDVNLAENDKYWLKEISRTILDTRRIGHNGVSVVFPKLVYLYDENQINNDRYSSELFDVAVKTSAKCMYPDYLSLSGDVERNKVAQEYSEHGTIISPMGCRAYLSHWEDPNTGKAVTVGRCNIGAVSLNIPVIMAVAKQEYGSEWKSKFWALLESRLQTIREFLCKRYELISHVKASTNPLAFTQGGFYNGYRKPDEEVGNLIDYMTASFGITALNESTILWNGKTLYEDKAQFANKVIDFIDDKVQKFKKEDHHLYALYGTPAESLCGKQAKQYAELTGDTQFGEYFTNSFHCHVSEDITPVEKQNAEYVAFHKVAGGHIQYVRIDNPENFEALKAIIVRGMHKGFYQGVNFDASHCNDCGYDYLNGTNKCPKCGSTNVTTISRVCGYLGYSNINGHSRMNDAKMAEVRDRKSM